MKKEEAVKLWKELGVGYAKFEFICGGDSMGDTETFLYKEDGTEIKFCFQKDDEGKIIDNEENKVVEQKIIDVRDLKEYIDNVIYNYVDFYVNSDGHYIGESGFVEIRLDEENEEDVDFTFIKEAESEWEESVSNEVLIKLKPKQIKFIKEYVRDINGDYDGMVINYKKDVLLKDETEKMIEEIELEIQGECSHYVPDEVDGDVRDYFTFSTNLDSEENPIVKTTKEGIFVLLINYVTVYTPSE